MAARSKSRKKTKAKTASRSRSKQSAKATTKPGKRAAATSVAEAGDALAEANIPVEAQAAVTEAPPVIEVGHEAEVAPAAEATSAEAIDTVATTDEKIEALLPDSDESAPVDVIEVAPEIQPDVRAEVHAVQQELSFLLRSDAENEINAAAIEATPLAAAIEIAAAKKHPERDESRRTSTATENTPSATASPLPVESAIPIAPPTSEEPEGPPKPVKILLVEDGNFLRLRIERALSRAGYCVVTATDGEKGLEVARTAQPDLILLDLLLPRIGGQDVLKTLKRDPATAGISVVVLTGLSHKNAERLLADGALAFFEKSELALEKGSEFLLAAVSRIVQRLPAVLEGRKRAVAAGN